MSPQRIQLKRTRGWRKPDGVVNVSRPGPWGNPFVPEAGPGGWLLAVHGKERGDARVMDIARQHNATGPWTRPTAILFAVEAFRHLHDNELSRQSMRHHLKGKAVACWCKVGDPCHGDVVLEFANHSVPTTCGKRPADATAEKTDFSDPVRGRNAAPAAPGEIPADPEPEDWKAIAVELEAMLMRGEVELTPDGKYRATAKFPRATEAEIDSMLDRRADPVAAVTATQVAEIAERMAMKVEVDFLEWWERHFPNFRDSGYTSSDVAEIGRRAFIAGRGPRFQPLHPARLWHPLERALREEWEAIGPANQGRILAGPECQYNDMADGTEYDANKLTGGCQPFPYGRMTERDRMVAAEMVQWLGTGVGFNFLCRAFRKAGGKVEFDDYRTP